MLADLGVEECAQFAGGRLGPVAQDDKGLGALANPLIGDPDDQDFANRRMGRQDGFELARENLEPADVDHVLDPVDDPKIAFGVDGADIARPE